MPDFFKKWEAAALWFAVAMLFLGDASALSSTNVMAATGAFTAACAALFLAFIRVLSR